MNSTHLWKRIGIVFICTNTINDLLNTFTSHFSCNYINYPNFATLFSVRQSIFYSCQYIIFHAWAYIFFNKLWSDTLSNAFWKSFRCSFVPITFSKNLNKSRLSCRNMMSLPQNYGHCSWLPWLFFYMPCSNILTNTF